MLQHENKTNNTDWKVVSRIVKSVTMVELLSQLKIDSLWLYLESEVSWAGAEHYTLFPGVIATNYSEHITKLTRYTWHVSYCTRKITVGTSVAQ